MDKWKLLDEETATLVMITVIEGILAFLVGGSGEGVFFSRSFVGEKFCQSFTKASAHPDSLSAG